MVFLVIYINLTPKLYSSLKLNCDILILVVFLLKTLKFYVFMNKLVKHTAYFLACISIVYFNKYRSSIYKVLTLLSSFIIYFIISFLQFY